MMRMTLFLQTILRRPYLTEQFRFPRSKKKRICAKWAKRAKNSRPARKAFIMGAAIVCHPTMAAQLREQIAAEEAENALLHTLFDR